MEKYNVSQKAEEIKNVSENRGKEKRSSSGTHSPDETKKKKLKKDKKSKKDKKERKEKKDRKKRKELKKHSKKKHKSRDCDVSDSDNDSDSDSGSSSDDSQTLRSSITGKKIKRQRDESLVDRLNAIERATKRQFMNASFN